MDQIINTLKLIKNSIQNETIITDRVILSVLLNESIAELIEMEIHYEVTYKNNHNKEHYKRYRGLGNMYKARLLCDLHELLIEVESKNINEKFVLSTINHLLDTGLYRNRVQAVINKFRPAVAGELHKEILTIK